LERLGAAGPADRVLRLLSAMPSGLNSIVVAHAYGLDMEITAEAVTWSTAIVVVAALVSLLF
jgi:predicted permease